MANNFEQAEAEYSVAKSKLRNIKMRLLGDIALGGLSVATVVTGLVEISSNNIGDMVIGLGLTVLGAGGVGLTAGITTDNYEFYGYAKNHEEIARARVESMELIENQS